jgi:hypothetical protein
VPAPFAIEVVTWRPGGRPLSTGERYNNQRFVTDSNGLVPSTGPT